MISLSREVAHPKQTQFPICSAAEGLEHALIDRRLPPAFLAQKSPHFAASDPHARRMLEGEFSRTALKVSAAEHCKHHEAKRFGFYGRNKIHRYCCPGYKATFSEPRRKPIGRHYISTEKAAQVVTFLLERMSVRAVSRTTGVQQGTILSLLLTVGNKSRSLSDSRVRIIRPRGRFQITTDGLNIYRNAIEEYFGEDVDFAQLLKLDGKGSTESAFGGA
jgi:transposase-like protein